MIDRPEYGYDIPYNKQHPKISTTKYGTVKITDIIHHKIEIETPYPVGYPTNVLGYFETI